jgi:60 kDa SS-A/Ro ribonucleoprotein
MSRPFSLEHCMRINIAPKTIRTHEGGAAVPDKPTDELRRTVMACLLWESGFYESGEAVAEREKQRLRHAPLLLVRELARDSKRCAEGLIANTLCRVIQRADELAEFLAVYWADEKSKNARARAPLAKQVKKGLACAFGKFNEYALAKYNRDSTVKLRDVLFMVHAKPADEEQAALWKRLVDGTLAEPDTWEVALSAGAEKKEAFERLLRYGKLGYMALLRNLRNMQQAEVDTALVFAALAEGAAKSRALPFRYVAAARAVPMWESQIDEAMQVALGELDKLPGRTAVLVDVSGSMSEKLSKKSDLSRLDAAAALAVLVRGIAQEARIFRFDDRCEDVPARQCMALIDAIGGTRGGTLIGQAVAHVRKLWPQMDRLIVITDEQSADAVGLPGCNGYMVNVATNQNGVGYGDWTRINGFSEAVVQYIAAVER